MTTHVTCDVISVLEVTKLLNFRIDTMQAASQCCLLAALTYIVLRSLYTQAKRVATHPWQ